MKNKGMRRRMQELKRSRMVQEKLQTKGSKSNSRKVRKNEASTIPVGYSTPLMKNFQIENPFLV